MGWLIAMLHMSLIVFLRSVRSALVCPSDGGGSVLKVRQDPKLEPFQAFAHVTSISMSLAKPCHIAKPSQTGLQSDISK